MIQFDRNTTRFNLVATNRTDSSTVSIRSVPIAFCPFTGAALGQPERANLFSTYDEDVANYRMLFKLLRRFQDARILLGVPSAETQNSGRTVYIYSNLTANIVLAVSADKEEKIKGIEFERKSAE